MNTVSKNIFFHGSYAIFFIFGAGNLIFPPMLGQNAGENFWPAMIDFTNRSWLTTTNCYRNFSIWKWNAQLASHVHPLFGIFFTVIVYIAIGASMGIPRVANVAYEMGLVLSYQKQSALAT